MMIPKDRGGWGVPLKLTIPILASQVQKGVGLGPLAIEGSGSGVGYEAHLSYVFFEGLASLFREAADGEGVLSFEGFFDDQIFCRFQLGQMARQVSLGEAAFALQTIFVKPFLWAPTQLSIKSKGQPISGLALRG